MKEAEWLACDDPGKMLNFLGRKASERKLRLFVVACCLGDWSSLYEDRSRRLVELAERYADGEASEAELAEARRIAYPGELLSMIDPKVAGAALVLVRVMKREPARQVRNLREIFGNPFRRRRSTDPAWLSWSGGTVRKLDQSIYDERAFDRLPVLADALEEAGCTDAVILSHCRSGEGHVRGCWVVDLLLDRE
jgi:hypothetical protein